MTDEAFDRDWDATIDRLVADIPAEWSISGYKGHNTHDGVAWVARLRLDRKPVAFLEDSGTGGSVFTQFIIPGVGRDRVSEARWEAMVKAVLPDEKFEPDQMVIEALLIRAGK